MKTLATLVLLAAMATAAFAAELPDVIRADYLSKAEGALKRLNETLEKSGAPIVAALVKAGDTTNADKLTAQIKDKVNGEPVVGPVAQGVTLFTQYDSARWKALEPVQKATIARIDAALASQKDLTVISQYSKLRAEIESGKAGSVAALPAKWDYFTVQNGRKMGSLAILPDGGFELNIPTATIPTESGTWKPSKKSGTLILSCRGEKWEVIIDGDTATIERPNVGVRWLKVSASP